MSNLEPPLARPFISSLPGPGRPGPAWAAGGGSWKGQRRGRQQPEQHRLCQPELAGYQYRGRHCWRHYQLQLYQNRRRYRRRCRYRSRRHQVQRRSNWYSLRRRRRRRRDGCLVRRGSGLALARCRRHRRGGGGLAVARCHCYRLHCWSLALVSWHNGGLALARCPLHWPRKSFPA